MTRLRFFITTTLFLIPTAVFAGPAFYSDVGGSLVKMHSVDPFWGTGIPDANTGYGLNFGIFTTFTKSNPTVELQFGILDRFSSASSTNPAASYQLMALYPVLRLQLSRIYLSAGVSPYIMRGLTYNGMENSLAHVKGGSSYLGEVGVLFPITPKFSFGTSISAEYVHDNGSSSPSPVAAANLLMRFYFGFGEGGEAHKSTEFRGWRYPFGRD